MSNIADISADIRKHSPGVWPPGFFEGYGIMFACNDVGFPRPISDELATLILIAAMVMDGHFSFAYCYGSGGWEVKRDIDDWKGFADSDHGGSLGACYAAWRWAKGLSPCGETGTNKESK